MASASQTNNHAPRLVKVPGFHIHPQYDLVHLRHVLHLRRSKKPHFHLNLAPMVDMFSILVIYLIMNFSSSGDAFFVSKGVTIPKASKGLTMQSYPIISIVGQNVAFDAENSEGKGGYLEEPNDGQVPQLRLMLKKVRDIEVQIGGEKAFKGQVNFQADEKTPIEDVKKVMRVLMEEGWTGINFIVDPSKRGK